MKTSNLLLTFIVFVSASLAANETNAVIKEEVEIVKNCKWGSSTNDILLGVGIWGTSPFTVHTYLMATNSKGHAGPAPAPHGYRLDISLQGADGKFIERTKSGNALCKPVGFFMKRSINSDITRGVYVLGPNIPRVYDDKFNLLDCFKIITPGNYTLFVKGTLYRRRIPSPAEAIPMDLPVSSVKVDVTQADLDCWDALK